MCSIPMVNANGQAYLGQPCGHPLKRCGNLGVRAAIRGNARLRSARLFQLPGDPPTPARAGYLPQLIDVTRLAGTASQASALGVG